LSVESKSDANEQPQEGGFPLVQDLAVDQIVADRYRVISLLAQGGMGCVYLVEQVFLKKEYALKTLHPSNFNSAAWRRFQKEARAASLLDHDTLIKVHDFGMVQDEQPFFVMDYFDGETLAQRIKRDGPLKLDVGLDIFMRVCFGLGYAHSQRVVHRDIKPSNIMLSKPRQKSWAQPDVKIVDFGIAKMLDVENADSLSLTRTGEVFGTPFYMSPEQCMGTGLDHRSDIYSLGCVMYEAFTGLPPFIGENALAIMMKHQSDVAPPLKQASLGLEFPEALEQIIARMLAKKPDSRYQNLYDVSKDLNRLKMGRPVEMKETAPSTQPAVPSKVPGRSVSFSMAIALSVAVAVASFVLGRLTAPQAPETGSGASAASSAQPASGGAAPAVVPQFDAQFYSKAQGSDRWYHFPAEQIGSLIKCSKKSEFVQGDEVIADQGGRITCQNNVLVRNFEPFGFSPNQTGTQSEEVWRRFRPDEIVLVDARENPFADDRFLKMLALAPHIFSVELEGCEKFTDKGLASLDQLKELTCLGLGGTHATADGIMKLSNLGKFKRLRLLGVKPVHKLLVALQQNAKNLEQLTLRDTDLDSQDLDVLSRMHSLKQLDISNCHRLHDKDLQKLCALPLLEDLSVSGMDVTPRAIPIFMKMPKLKRVALHELEMSGWTPIERSRLRASLPEVMVFEHHIQYSDVANDGLLSQF